MIEAWAEKETRNLSRLYHAGLSTAEPIELKENILVMKFIGENGIAAPILKNANLDIQDLKKQYKELIKALRTLYQKCKLVHADFSEYNILYHENKCYIIDVGQSVELDHPLAHDFLREDCEHLNSFFIKKGIDTILIDIMFSFIIDESLSENNINDIIESLHSDPEKY